jgi:hypothetical protein
MQMLQSLFYLTIALHVSGFTITQLQEHKTTVTTASGNRYTVLLSAAIVEEFQLQFHHRPVQACNGIALLIQHINYIFRPLFCKLTITR